MSGEIRIAILGATGAVGTEMLQLLESRNFPIASLRLLASSRSAGKTVQFKQESLLIEELTENSFKGIDLVLASAGGEISKTWLPIAVKAGAVAVDNSSAFRMSPDVPLVVPEINPEAIPLHQGIIANPNCTTIIMGVSVWPLHRVNPIKRLIVSTYQSASGAGAQAMAELTRQTEAILQGKTPPTNSFPYPLAFNLFPHNSPLNEQGYCQEEMKMVNETRKIFNEPEFKLSATCVRVPVLRAHSEAINLEFDSPLAVSEARAILAQAPGVKLVEDWQANYFPMPIDATGKDEVLVGRIRKDISLENGLELWVCGDQIRKGAALNAVQIAELLVSRSVKTR